MPEAEDLLKLIEPLGDNKANLAFLVKQLGSPLGVVPFVGAGMSVPFQFPDWKTFLLEQAPDAAMRGQIEQRLAKGEYEEAAEDLLGVRGGAAFQDSLEFNFGRNLGGAGLAQAAVCHLPHLATGPFITTNFDRVLEAVFAAAELPFEQIVLGMKLDAIRAAFHLKNRVLLKLHGDAGDRTDRVFTLSDYQKNYGETHPLRGVLQVAMIQPLLFLGCSLKQDRTMRVLESLAKGAQGLMQHYAVLERPASDDEFAQRRRYFSEMGVRCIWYPTTQHSLTEPLLAHLVRERAKAHAAHAAAKKPREALHLDLPQAPSTWVGRADELKKVIEEMEGARVVIIEGARGSGKTALALRVIDHHLGGERFGAIVWTTAKGRPVSLPECLDNISLTLDFPHTLQLPMPQKEAVLLDELQGRAMPCLIALDNFETIDDPGVIELVSAKLPRCCTVLITSARPVPIAGDDVSVIRLEELPQADARDYFQKRAARRGLDAVSEAQFADLFALLGGNPLALEWVVGQMSSEGREIEWIVEDLRQGKGDIFDSLFASSWTALPEAARLVLGALALLATDATEEALAATCGLATAEFREALIKLRQLYLLRRVHTRSSPSELVPVGAALDTVRYGVHPLTREYVRRRLPELGVEAGLCERAGQYYLALIKQHGGSPDKEAKSDLRRLNSERPNILAALQFTSEREDQALFIELVETLSRWFFINGLWEALERWAPKGIDAAMAANDLLAAARLHNELGRVYSYRSEFKFAEAAFAKALDLARKANDAATLAYIGHHFGECQIRQGRFDEAGPLLEASLAQFEALPSRRECIGVRYRLAELAFKRGDFTAAKEKFRRGLKETQEEKWERLEAYHRNYLGDLATREGDLTEGRLQYERARELVPETDTRRLAFLELSLAQLEQRADRREVALASAERAREHFRKLGMGQESEDAARLVLELAG